MDNVIDMMSRRRKEPKDEMAQMLDNIQQWLDEYFAN
jgi:hypothetical protein